jgi:GGDEF domain-containing protein
MELRRSRAPSLAPLAEAPVSSDVVIRNGARAVLRASEGTSAVEPLAGALVRARTAFGQPANLTPLLEWWHSRAPGNPRGDMRYRWELTHKRGVPMPAYASSELDWHAWREFDEPLVRRDPFEVEARLLTPVILTENCELLGEAQEAPGELAELAQSLLEEAGPVLRRDFAGFVQAGDPWQDTFALFRLVRRPHALALLHPLAVAIATCYAAGNRGPVLGTRYPVHQQPLVSASAQLAAGLLALGSDLELVAELVEFVKSSRSRAGGWGDAGAPDDPLTTWVAADLLLSVDPSFDPAATARLLASMQHDDGFWRGLGPDAPWLTFEIVTWLLQMRRPFAQRFRWPFLPAANRDRKTGLPFYAYFADLARLFAALPGLADTTAEIAFIDLAGFRAFNNRYGQDRGDDVLAEFARELDALPGARAIRDGGDEFLLIGAPRSTGLAAELESFRRSWPNRFAETFGADVPPVVPRILVGATRGTSLPRAREHLGREIGALKSAAAPPLVVLGDLGF